jgi:hypothetical protein
MRSLQTPAAGQHDCRIRSVSITAGDQARRCRSRRAAARGRRRRTAPSVTAFPGIAGLLLADRSSDAPQPPGAPRRRYRRDRFIHPPRGWRRAAHRGHQALCVGQALLPRRRPRAGPTRKRGPAQATTRPPWRAPTARRVRTRIARTATCRGIGGASARLATSAAGADPPPPRPAAASRCQTKRMSHGSRAFGSGMPLTA